MLIEPPVYSRNSVSEYIVPVRLIPCSMSPCCSQYFLKSLGTKCPSLTHRSKETMLEQHLIPAIITNARIRPLSARAKAKSNPEHTRHSMHKRFSVRICCNTFRRRNLV